MSIVSSTFSNTIELSPAYLGVDPGASGGMTLLQGSTIATYRVDAYQDDAALWYAISGIAHSRYKYGFYCCLEQVTGYMGESKGSEKPGSRMFNFGVSYGKLQAFLTAAGIPYILVSPNVWQRALGIKTKGKEESKSRYKARLKAIAQARYPRHPLTLDTADSLLIALYCKQVHEKEQANAANP